MCIVKCASVISYMLNLVGYSLVYNPDLLNSMFEQTALDIWSIECNAGIRSLCKSLDTALGCGFPLGKITELYGAPGTGKTQMCLQLCVTVQIPKCLGGMKASALFIDTNRGFSTIRFKEVASSLVSQFQSATQTNASDMQSFNVDNIQRNVLYTEVTNASQLLAAVHLLPTTLTDNPNVRLICIDSFSFLFRESSTNRTRILFQLLTDLQKLADDHNCAIVITNELTTRIVDLNESYLVPALGDSHSHRVTQQISLSVQDANEPNRYVASVVKSLYNPVTSAEFKNISVANLGLIDL